MKKNIAVSLVLVLVAALPATAHAGGSLDPSFGRGGRVLVPASASPAGSEANAKLWTAPAPDGKLVAVGGNQVMQFLGDGRLDPAFSGDGRIEIAVEPGRSFSPVGVAVDSQGRILVAGTSTPPAGTPNTGPQGSPPGPLPTRATVIRYLPDGSLDPGFGSGGIVTTPFEIAPPTTTPGGGPAQRYESAVVTATALAITATDQAVLTGTYATVANSDCYARAGYAARLDASGNIDRSFGEKGVAYDQQIQQPEVLTRSESGDLLYSGLTAPRPVGSCFAPGPGSVSANFADLLPTGQANLGFGSGGQRPHNQSQVYALAVDGRGRLVSLEQSWPSAYPESEGKLRVRRLLPTGAPDLAFGHNGSVWPKAAVGFSRQLGIQALAVDGRNRILLAGGGKTAKGAFGFQLMRLGTKGKLDLGFGRRGRVKTGFGSAAETKASTLSLGDDGSIVLGGAITGSPKLPTGEGFAFARYQGN